MTIQTNKKNHQSTKHNHQPFLFDFFNLFGGNGVTNSHLDFQLTTDSFSSLHQWVGVMQFTFRLQRSKLDLYRSHTDITPHKSHFVPYFNLGSLTSWWLEKSQTGFILKVQGDFDGVIELGTVGIFHHGTFVSEGSIFWIGKLEPAIKMSFYVTGFDVTSPQKWPGLLTTALLERGKKI